MPGLTALEAHLVLVKERHWPRTLAPLVLLSHPLELGLVIVHHVDLLAWAG